jgi:hypothetical protein
LKAASIVAPGGIGRAGVDPRFAGVRFTVRVRRLFNLCAAGTSAGGRACLPSGARGIALLCESPERTIDSMKLNLILVLLTLGFVVPATQAQAQGRGGGRGRGMGTPATPPPAAPAQPPAATAPAQPVPPGATKFGDLAVKTSFYFLSDTNQTYLWTKISSTTASNTVNKKLVPIATATLVKSN